MFCYQIQDNGRNGNRPSLTAVFYAFHPEVGPKGTPGRGPYCLSRQPLRARDRARGFREIEAHGFVLLSEALTDAVDELIEEWEAENVTA